MKLSIALSFFTALATITLLVSCQKEDVTPDVDKSFSIEAKRIQSYRATLVIRHNGSNRDQYTGFIIEGHNINLDSIVAHHEITYKDVLYQKKRVITVTGLLPDKEYTYIVIGLDENRHYNGRNGFFKFTTRNERINTMLNDNWNVSYKGQVTYKNGYWSGIDVNVKRDNERYIFMVYSKTEREQFDNEDEFLVYASQKYGSTYNEEDDENFWMSNDNVYYEGWHFYRLLDPGEYVAYAIGVDKEGNATGKYNRTDYFTETEYPMTTGYTNMIGHWKLTDAEGISFNIELAKDKVNQTLIVKNWGNRTDQFSINYLQTSQTILFKPCKMEENVNYTINNESRTGDLYLAAWYETISGGMRITTDISIARGVSESTQKYIIKSAFTANTSDGTEGITEAVYDTHDNRFYRIKNTPMTFPIIMEKL